VISPAGGGVRPREIQASGLNWLSGASGSGYFQERRRIFSAARAVLIWPVIRRAASYATRPPAPDAPRTRSVREFGNPRRGLRARMALTGLLWRGSHNPLPVVPKARAICSVRRSGPATQENLAFRYSGRQPAKERQRRRQAASAGAKPALILCAGKIAHSTRKRKC